jgi:hypothetical protein
VRALSPQESPCDLRGLHPYVGLNDWNDEEGAGRQLVAKFRWKLSGVVENYYAVRGKGFVHPRATHISSPGELPLLSHSALDGASLSGLRRCFKPTTRRNASPDRRAANEGSSETCGI